MFYVCIILSQTYTFKLFIDSPFFNKKYYIFLLDIGLSAQFSKENKPSPSYQKHNRKIYIERKVDIYKISCL